jgi:hypothetical protein
LLPGAWPAWNPDDVAGDRRRPARSSKKRGHESLLGLVKRNPTIGAKKRRVPTRRPRYRIRRRSSSQCRSATSIARASYWAPGGTWIMAADGSERRWTSRGSEPSFAPDGLHYAYVRSRGGVRRIWRARIDGGDKHHLRAGRSPLWSPGGRTIAYYRKGVWIMNARTGERLRRVAPRWMTPLDWSPDGRRLLCSGYADGSDLYTVRAHGKRRPRRLTRTPARSESEAAWSPRRSAHRIWG